MKPSLYLLACLLLACLAAGACSKRPAVPILPPKQDVRVEKPAVKLGYGDELNIDVWRHEDLRLTVKVDDAGDFTFPMAGQIHAEGRSMAQIRDELTQKLDKYLVDPQVSITAATLRSQTVVLAGEVKTPGALVIDHDMSLYEAVARVGGMTDDADESATLLFRDDGERPSVFMLDMRLGEKLGENVAGFNRHVQDGDVIYVPKSGIASAELFMMRLNNILQPLLNLERFIIFMPQVRDAVDNLRVGKDAFENATVVQTAGGEVISNNAGVVSMSQ